LSAEEEIGVCDARHFLSTQKRKQRVSSFSSIRWRRGSYHSARPAAAVADQLGYCRKNELTPLGPPAGERENRSPLWSRIVLNGRSAAIANEASDVQKANCSLSLRAHREGQGEGEGRPPFRGFRISTQFSLVPSRPAPRVPSVHLNVASPNAASTEIEPHIWVVSQERHRHGAVHQSPRNHERRQPLTEWIVVFARMPDGNLFRLPGFNRADGTSAMLPPPEVRAF